MYGTMARVKMYGAKVRVNGWSYGKGYNGLSYGKGYNVWNNDNGGTNARNLDSANVAAAKFYVNPDCCCCCS